MVQRSLEVMAEFSTPLITAWWAISFFKSSLPFSEEDGSNTLRQPGKDFLSGWMTGWSTS
jgi:hypothetical protein